ncbi:MAG: YeeE/YedE family protein [Promethearchaeota archaeon]
MEFIYAMVVGLIIGAIFGFILQRGRFCMNSAFRDIILLKEFKLAKAVAVSLVVLMVGFAIFAFTGLDLSVATKGLSVGFLPWAAIVGGLVFGIGMVLAAGCASGTTYRVGEGMIGSFVAAIGLTVGALMTMYGVLNGLSGVLKSVNVGPNLTIFGVFDATLTPILMLVVGIVGIVLMFYFWAWPALQKRKGEPLIKFDRFVDATFKKAYPWWVTGILIGLILTAGLVASGGVVGITGGWINISNWLTAGEFSATSTLGWSGFIIFGILIGAMVSAIIAKEFKLRVPKEGFTVLKQFFGGILMGFGAVTAMGCNITNILGGIPMLSIHSIITGACIMFGSWIAAYFLFMWKKD